MLTAEHIVKKILKEGATDAAVELNSGITKQVRFTNNRVFLSSSWLTTSAELFIAVGKKTISTVLSDSSSLDSAILRPAEGLSALDATIKKAVKMAKFLKPKEDYYGLAEGPFKYKKKAAYDRKIANINLSEKADEAIDAAIRHGAKRASGILYGSVGDVSVATSNGVDANRKNASIEISVRAFCQPDESGHDVSCATALKDFSPKAAGKRAGELAKMARHPSVLEEGKYDVVFAPLSASNLLESIGAQSTAFYVEAGFSPFNGKLGKKVGSECVNIYDDATISGGFGSTPFDYEGVPTQKNAIIKDGILRTYLHNTSTAKKFKAKTTANAGIMAPHPWNIVFEGGDFKESELFSESKRCIYVTDVWYTRFQNYRTGDFSTIPRDCCLLFEKGRPVKSLKGLRISDNLLNLLKNVQAAARNRQWIHWWEISTPVLTPSILIKNVNITKPTI